jgi:hypothetical protein
VTLAIKSSFELFFGSAGDEEMEYRRGDGGRRRSI